MAPEGEGDPDLLFVVAADLLSQPISKPSEHDLMFERETAT